MTTTPPEPVDNPVLRVLHQRHPEVDIVVLPDPARPRRHAPAARDERVAVATNTLMDDVVRRLPEAAGPARRSGRWRTSPEGYAYYESIAVWSGLEPGANVEGLRATGNALLGQGWLARPVPGSHPRLIARRSTFRAAAEVTPGGLTITISSGRLAHPGTPKDGSAS